MKNQSSYMAQNPLYLQFRKLFVWKAILSILLLLALSLTGGQGHAQAAAYTHFIAHSDVNSNLACPFTRTYDLDSGITLERSTGEILNLKPDIINDTLWVDVSYGSTFQGYPLPVFTGDFGYGDGNEIEVYNSDINPSLATNKVDVCTYWGQLT